MYTITYQMKRFTANRRHYVTQVNVYGGKMYLHVYMSYYGFCG